MLSAPVKDHGKGGPAVKVLLAVKNGALVEEFMARGLEVVAIETEEELEAGLDADAAFAVVDEAVPFAVDFIVKVKATVDGPARDRAPVLVVGGPTGPAIRCVPDTFVEQATAEQLAAMAAEIVKRRARQRRLFDQEAVLKVPTTADLVDKAGDLLEELVGAAGYAEEDAVKLSTTFREALGNAAEHGNKNDPTRTVHINFLRTHDRVALAITDEGPGFDTSSFLARADEVSALEHTRSRRETEFRPGGLGVFIMKETCDAITFNEAGNTIYLMKYLPGRAPS